MPYSRDVCPHMTEIAWKTEAAAHVVTDYRGMHWQATVVEHGACPVDGPMVRDVFFNAMAGSREEAELRLRGAGVSSYVVRDRTGREVGRVEPPAPVPPAPVKPPAPPVPPNA